MIKNSFKILVTDPLSLITIVFEKLFIFYIAQRKNIEIKDKLLIKGKPIVEIRKGCKLFIGNNVTLNSRNRGYHVNLHSPVKLFAENQAKIIIGDRTRIHGSCIHACNSITIGKNCLIAANCQIIDSNGHDLSFPDVENRINTKGLSKPIIIEDNVWIGANTIVLPGVTIGNGSVISASSVVVKDVPPMVISGGNPSVVLKHY